MLRSPEQDTAAVSSSGILDEWDLPRATAEPEVITANTTKIRRIVIRPRSGTDMVAPLAPTVIATLDARAISVHSLSFAICVSAGWLEVRQWNVSMGV